MNALAKEEVGNYLNEYFVSSHQKISNFRIVGKQKQGGNVASYFCTPDFRVLHAVAGPVDEASLLREARWVVESWKLAQLQGQMDKHRLKVFFRKLHGERLRHDHGVDYKRLLTSAYEPTKNVIMQHLDRANRHHGGLGTQGQIHSLLATFPNPKLDQMYEVVFERILGQRLSAMPVVAQQ